MDAQRLERILDAHQGPALRPFTKADRMAFAGCESEAPEIASFAWGDVVLDGLSVQVFVYGPEEGEVQRWAGAFPRPEDARRAAEAILEADDPTGLDEFLDPEE